MGSLFDFSGPPSPPPPPLPSGYRDEIGGTEQVPVTNPDGSTTYITRRIAPTAEEQAEQEAYEKIMQDALKEIERFSSVDYEDDESTKAILNAWEDERSSRIEDTFDNRENAEEELLARRGLSSSSAAEAVRRRRREDERLSYRSLDNETELMAEDIRQNNLSYQQNLYNVAAGRDNLEQARVLQSVGQGISQVNAANSYRRASLMDYYNARANRYQIQQGADNDRLRIVGAIGAGL